MAYPRQFNVVKQKLRNGFSHKVIHRSETELRKAKGFGHNPQRP